MNIVVRDKSPATIAPAKVGVGLKSVHYEEILATRPEIGFLEIHAENYMNDGGPNLRFLSALAEHYPLSVHGVGLSLGSTEKLDLDHLARLKKVVARAAPALVSEHLAWSDFSGRAFPDLLPLPYDEAALARVAGKIETVQESLGRLILIENPATYLRFEGDSIAEPQFLAELCARSGCGLLLDVNNVHVSAINHGFDAQAYLDSFPMDLVGEIHLAGAAEARDARGAFLIDNHGGPVADAVWALYRYVIARAGPRPTLIEWDNNVPDWATLFAETRKARQAMGELAPLPAHEARIGVTARRSRVERRKGENPQDCAWQARFAAALRDPDRPAPPLFAPCDAETRFAVYRNNSAVAEIGALKEQFPAVLHLVGDEAFSGLARTFARQFPPRSPILGEYGAEFPDFIQSFLDQVGETQTPYLPDVARLDWACLRALRAEEAEPCGLARLAALDPAHLGALRVKIHPALSLVASDWPLLALRDPDGRSVEDWRGQALLVTRRGAEVRLVALATGAAAFLSALLDGATAGQAAAAGERAETGFDFGQTLVALTKAGAFVDFVPKK
jgi:uncharacterized protein (UPF0276 family)